MKRKLADVLWEAANTHLARDHEDEEYGCSDLYSCYAVSLALGVGGFPNVRQELLLGLSNPLRQVMTFLYRLGLQYGGWVGHKGDLQGVRYMWLLLAMHVAEDEDIEIEVSA